MNAHKLWIPALCLLLCMQGGALPWQEKTPAQPASADPYSMGERLTYIVKWDPPWYFFFLPNIEAGEIDLQLAGETEYKGGNAWKIVFRAHSSGTLLKMAGVKVEDEFVFITDPETLCTSSMSQKEREGKRKRQIDVEYLRDSEQLHIRDVDESVTPPRVKKDLVLNNIPPCVHDPLSAIYLLRRSELRPKHEQVFFIGYSDRIKEIRAQVEKQEFIETPAGKFPAWNIKTAALMGGLFKEGGQFRIWLSADQKKVPLQFEAKVSLGKVVGKLKSMSN